MLFQAIVTVLVHNNRSLLRHVDDIVSDNRIINNDVIGLTETQIKQSGSTCKIIETLNLFNINFNNNENKFLTLAHGCRSDVAVLNEFNANGVSILSFNKHPFADRVFTFMLVYRKQSMHMQEFFQMLQYLLATNSIDVIAGDYNYDFFKRVTKYIFRYFYKPCPYG